LFLCAGVAQLVEHQLPKLRVASSNLVARSNLFHKIPYSYSDSIEFGA
jgi:hypothetical protein